MVAFIYLLSDNSNVTVGYVEAAFGCGNFDTTLIGVVRFSRGSQLHAPAHAV